MNNLQGKGKGDSVEGGRAWEVGGRIKKTIKGNEREREASKNL